MDRNGWCISLVAGTATLLLVGFGVMWVRSYSVNDWISHGRNGYAADTTLIRRFIGIRSSRGYVTIGKGEFSSLLFRSTPVGEGFVWKREEAAGQQANQGVVWEFAGFRYAKMEHPLINTWSIAVPYWSLAVVVGIPLVGWAIRRHRWARRVSGVFFPICGYDLRATPERCPECGTEKFR